MTREEFINWCEERFALTKNDIYELGQLYDEVIKPHWMPLPQAPTVAKNATVKKKGGKQ